MNPRPTLPSRTAPPRFGGARAPWIAAGFPLADLLPIIPPRGRIAPRSTVDPASAGKVPGLYRADGWVGLGGSWAASGLSAHEVSGVASAPTTSVGLRSSAYPGLDIDIDDPDLADAIMASLSLITGHAPSRSRRGSPRALYMFRSAQGAVIRKRRLEIFVPTGSSGQFTKHAVELLGHGQQYVVAGEHATGTRYEWNTPPQAQALPIITAEIIAEIFRIVTVESTKLGYTVRESASAHHGSDTGLHYNSLPAIAPVELILDALWWLRNDEAEAADRNALVRRMSAFKSAAGNAADGLAGEVIEWAVADGFCDETYATHIWDSIHSSNPQRFALFLEAQALGWDGWAQSRHDEFTGELGSPPSGGGGERPPADPVALAGIAARYVYHQPSETWIRRDTGVMMQSKAFNRSVDGLQMDPEGKGSLLALQTIVALPRVDRLTYHPGAPELFEHRGQRTFNMWRPGRAAPPADLGEPTPWLNHVAWLFPGETERGAFLDWAAATVQLVGTKIRFAPLIYGRQGIGKDTLIRPLLKYFGSDNVAEIGGEMLSMSTNTYLEKQFTVITEIKRGNRIDVYEKFKPFISGSAADTLAINEKYQPLRYIPNLVNIVFFTNHEDAMTIDPDDRRILALSCEPTEPRHRDYYMSLYRWFDAGGVDAVVSFLMRRDLSAFSPAAAPAHTAYRAELVELSRSALADWISGQVEHGAFAGCTVLTVDEVFGAATAHIDGAPYDARPRSKQQLGLHLRMLGWHGTRVRIEGGLYRVWCKSPEVAKSGGPMIEARWKREHEQLAKKARQSK